MSFLSTATWVFFGAVLATALALFPFRVLATRFGMVDHPDNVRKLQKMPVPVGGGLVVFLVMTTVMTLLFFCQDRTGFQTVVSANLLLPLIIVSPFIIVVGIVDDARGISGKTKLLCQIIAATVIIGFAKYYSEITYFGIELNLHHLFYPLAIFWVIGMVNAINLLDGADGVAVTVSFFMTLATAGLAFVNGHAGIVLICLGLAGCLLGFFVHNRPSAKVYLGDTGSMFIGLILATLMLRASVESDKTISICGPLAIALIPIVDSVFAVIRRTNTGRTIFSPDRGHIHHLLSQKTSSPYGVLLLLSLLVIPGCVAAVAGTYYRNDLIPVAVSAVVLIAAAVLDLFGRREFFILLGRSSGRFCKCFYKEKYRLKNGEVYHIQGNGPWKEIWNRLIPLVREYPCRRLQLDINMPHRNEDFFGEWENVTERENAQPISCSISLKVEDRRVGTLRIFFENRGVNRDPLLILASELSSICEMSIAQYLEFGELDDAFCTLSFDSIVMEPAFRKPEESVARPHSIPAKRAA